MIPRYHFIVLNHLMLKICKMTVSPIFRVTFFACLAVRALPRTPDLSKQRRLPLKNLVRYGLFASKAATRVPCRSRRGFPSFIQSARQSVTHFRQMCISLAPDFVPTLPSVARWQNLIPSFPTIAPGWRGRGCSLACRSHSPSSPKG